MTHILVADDHAVVRRGLRNILEADLPGVAITEAADAREAVARLREVPFDLVLLDLNMPGRDGFEVLEEIRRDHSAARVLILTAYPEGEYAIRAFQLGASGYLNKQTASEELLTAAQRILAGGKYVTPSLAEKLAATLGGEIRVAPHELLSSRELQVLRQVALGRSLKEIAGEMGVSDKTVATYRRRIAEKTGLGTKVELTRYALQRGLVE
jgi:two-component system, NarL family, invasion response regulator UvrY